MALIDEYEQEQISPIRISRNGSVTRFLEDEASPTMRGAYETNGALEANAAGTLTPRARPMPKRLSEEARETVEAERQARIAASEEAPKPRARKPRKEKVPTEPDIEQMALPLKPPRAKTDSLVKQRQVLGLCCIVAAVLVLLAIISYSPDDASRAETRIGDLPSLFLPHGDTPDPVREAVRASADQAKNWLGLIGAMLANFLINKTIGYAAILYPIFFGAWSLAFFRFTYRQRRRLTLATTFFLLTAILFSATMGTASNFLTLPREWSGSVGQFLGIAFTRAIGGAGAFIIYTAALVVMLIFSIDLDIEKTFHRLKAWWDALVMWSRRRIIEFWEKREARQAAKEERRAAEEADAAINSQMTEETQMRETVAQTVTEAKAEELKSSEEVPAISPISPTPVAVAAIAEEPLPPAAQAETPFIVKATEYQPLLKVRPAKQHEGAAIPRLTRNPQERLGSQSRHFSRLTNGALGHEEETIVQANENPEIVAETIVPTAPSVEDESAELPNIDSSEELIEPLKRKAREPKLTASSVPVMLGDEKTLSNEALPHSISDEILIPLPLADKTSPPTPLLGKERGVDEDLFFEEGEKPVIPENPYLEILSKYRNPPLDILTPADPKDALDANDEELAKKGRLLRDKLATFGVEIENITVTPGPVVTLYEFTPAEGVKVSRVENLTDDIALAMKARGIRIIAPIPGRGTIGVEIPNDTAKIVRIRSLLESDSFRNTKMNLPLALGMTISGDVYVDDLNKMPHLLIAGATGSGKSVGVNGILASLIYAKSPRDVKFVIVDPKKIELSLYKKLRKHYLIVSPEAGEDIVTTPAFAVLALKAVELEMERRYDKLAKAAVRSLADYNIKVAQGKLRSTQEEQHYHLPYIVVIIDELADLMITAAREIEEPICRIAQMARAVGIHMILATQRPSVDVITGVIKANFPARMAYQVATRVDSRTILDVMGAEQLMGNGDMLYQPSGTPKPIRLQSPFISTEEVEAMIDAVAAQDGDKLSFSRPWTLPSLRQDDDDDVEIDDGDDHDELFEEAAKIVVRHQQGSVSLLQRRLKIGYSRAARVMDELEVAAIVGSFDGSKGRQVLCETEAELEVVLEGLR